MKTLMIRCCWRCVVLAGVLLGMLLPDAALAGKFRYPGEELLGTWRIVRYDMSEFAQPMSQEVMSGLIDGFSYFLPPGQFIQITFDGIYAQPPDKRVLPQLMMKTISPLSDSICRFGVWKDYTCKNGKVPAGFYLEDYVCVSVYSYGKSVDAVNPYRRKRSVPWPDASKYEYLLWAGRNNTMSELYVRTLKGNRLLVMFYGGDESWTNGGRDRIKLQEEIIKEKKMGTVYAVWERVTPPPANQK